MKVFARIILLFFTGCGVVDNIETVKTVFNVNIPPQSEYNEVFSFSDKMDEIRSVVLSDIKILKQPYNATADDYLKDVLLVIYADLPNEEKETEIAEITDKMDITESELGGFLDKDLKLNIRFVRMGETNISGEINLELTFSVIGIKSK